MENLWLKAHNFIINSKTGDQYLSGEGLVSVIKKTPKRVYFSNGVLVSIKYSKKGNFYYLSGKNINNILRDIEGYYLYHLHSKFI